MNRIKGKISEIFESIQGEGIYLGEKQIFVRLFGCNLSCGFCDTRPDSFTEYDPHELLEEIKLYRKNSHCVSFTGGEPLLQKDFLKDVLRLTHKAGFKNYLETNGTLSEELEEVIHDVHIVAMDLKLPSSTGLNGFWEEHHKFLKVASRKEVFLKAIICETTDEDDLKEGLRLIKEVDRSAVLILQPNSNERQVKLIEKLKTFKALCKKEKVTAFIIPQLHKIMGLK